MRLLGLLKPSAKREKLDCCALFFLFGFRVERVKTRPTLHAHAYL